MPRVTFFSAKINRGDAQKVWRKQIVSSAKTADPAKRNLEQPGIADCYFDSCVCVYLHAYTNTPVCLKD